MGERDAPLIAGVELGGTKCVCLLAHAPDSIVDRVTIPTSDPAATVAAVSSVLDRWRTDHHFAALGLAAFGPLELDPTAPDYGHVLSTPKPGWSGIDLLGALASRYDVPVAIDTDVGGAVAAEGRWGAARGLSTFAYVTVGTGVGVGIVADGCRIRGLGHPEAGHMHVLRAPGDGWSGSCVYHGDCVEGLASGSAIGQRTGRAPATIPSDDPVWPLVAHALAGMAHNLFMVLAPQRILFGGGVAMRQPQLFPLIRAKLRDSLAGYGAADRLPYDLEEFVRTPELGNDAGPCGAVALGLEAIERGSSIEARPPRAALCS